MNKKLFKLIICLFVFLPFCVNASYDAYINGDTVRIRENATTSSNIITTLNSNTDISVIDKNTISGSGCDNGWLKIEYNNKSGYVCSKYVSYVNSSFSGINTNNWTARVNGNNVTVRKSASTSSSSVTSLTLGTNVTILDTVNGSGSGCSSGKWYKIKYYDNDTGYMCSNYITKKEDIYDSDISNEYKEYLKSEGFPESYYPFLNYLHKKYPNWVFKAGITGLDFATSVNSEYGKCYMQTTNDNYRVSSTPSEGSSWFTVNKGVIAYYMDPRNFFEIDRLFMFESLSYDESLENNYTTLVKSIFGSGKLGDDKYVVPIVKASKTNNLNPVYVASRIRLEVGANGSDSTNGTSFTWKGQTYSGYYNFFNIGAYETTIDGVSYSSVTRGLAYAAKLIDRTGNPWNDIEVALTEGSTFLSNGYVSKGQATGYYQKFNVGPDAYYSKYTHQYMTNIQAPAIEASSSYNSYNNADLLNQAFVFEIPVFKNMPSYTSLPNSGDTINTLNSLEVENYSLTPSFDEDILTYEVYVPKNIDKINIKASLSSSKSKIDGIGEKEIKDNETMFTITVTSEIGEVKKYSITVHKVEDTTTTNDVINKINAKVIDSYLTNITYNYKASDFKNSLIKNGASSVNITNASNKQINDSDKLATGYKVTIKSSVNTNTYSISITGDTSGDGDITILDLLQIQKHLTNASKLSGANYYAADTSKDGDVTILDLLQVQKYLKGEKNL